MLSPTVSHSCAHRNMMQKSPWMEYSGSTNYKTGRHDRLLNQSLGECFYFCWLGVKCFYFGLFYCIYDTEADPNTCRTTLWQTGLSCEGEEISCQASGNPWSPVGGNFSTTYEKQLGKENRQNTPTYVYFYFLFYKGKQSHCNTLVQSMCRFYSKPHLMVQEMWFEYKYDCSWIDTHFLYVVKEL